MISWFILILFLSDLGVGLFQARTHLNEMLVLMNKMFVCDYDRFLMLILWLIDFW